MRSALVLPVLLAVLAPASAQEEKAPKADLTWVGCGITKKAFMASLAEAWQKKTGQTVALQGGGATRGIRDVSAGKADMGGTCRHKIDVPEEKNAKLHPVGWDAICVIANPKNPVTDISFKQLKQVLEGKITSWKQLGGPDQPILVYTRQGSISGVGLMSRELIFWNPKMEFKGSTKSFKSSGPLEKAVEKESYAIGLTGISSAKKRKVSVLKVNGRAPTVANIVSGKYPIVRPLYLATHVKPNDKTKSFVAWAKTEGQQHIEREGTVTLKQGRKLWAKYQKLIKISQMKSKAAKPGR